MNTELADCYQKDFYAWINKNVELLKTHRLNELDINNLIEEMEGMSRTERRSLDSHLTVLITHLLKWQFQPSRRTRGWKLTIGRQRMDIEKCLLESPSLKYELPVTIKEAFIYGRRKAIQETSLTTKDFPKENPYTYEQLMDEQFFPD